MKENESSGWKKEKNIYIQEPCIYTLRQNNQ